MLGDGKTKRWQSISLWPCILFLALGLVGCGYGFSGSGRLPGGVQRVFVSQISDRVGEAGLATWLGDDLVYVLMRSPQASVADNIKEADALIEGEIRSISETTLSRTVGDKDIERRVSLTVFFILRSMDGRVLWQREMQDSEAYAVGRDKTSTENNLQDALETLSLRMTETVVARMGDNF